MRFAVAVGVVLSLVACKREKQSAENGPAIDGLNQLADAMCKCADGACATKVAADMDQWTSDRARRGGYEPMPTEAVAAKIEVATKRYAECFEAASHPAAKTAAARSVADILSTLRLISERACTCRNAACGDAVVADLDRLDWRAHSQAASAAERAQLEQLTAVIADCVKKANGVPTVDADGLALPPAKPTSDADAIIGHTYSGLGKYVVSAIQVDYVRASGELDPKYGKATFALGIAIPPDPGEDPDRPLGAPVPDPVPPPDVSGETCPKLEWSKGTRSTTRPACALVKPIARPKCSVVEVWRRAVAAKAPPEGLAKLTYQAAPTAAWLFAIDDAPRKVKVRVTIPDTCEPTIERPSLPF